MMSIEPEWYSSIYGVMVMVEGPAQRNNRLLMLDRLRKLFAEFQRRAGGSTDPGAADAGLSRREREVLACMAHGASNRAIAVKLCISQETVKTHLRHVFTKLGVRNRVEAALAFHGKGGPPRESGSQAA